MAPKGKEAKAKNVPRQDRAGITFGVGRTASAMRKGKYADRISPGSAIFMAAVLEYVVAEVLELAGNNAHLRNKKLTGTI